jgi:hypothetical protein
MPMDASVVDGHVDAPDRPPGCHEPVDPRGPPLARLERPLQYGLFVVAYVPRWSASALLSCGHRARVVSYAVYLVRPRRVMRRLGVRIRGALVARSPRVASEIHRLLKSGGFVYSEIPFMQQVHEGAYDFTRYTLVGHRALFRALDDLEMASSAAREPRWCGRFVSSPHRSGVGRDSCRGCSMPSDGVVLLAEVL